VCLNELGRRRGLRSTNLWDRTRGVSCHSATCRSSTRIARGLPPAENQLISQCGHHALPRSHNGNGEQSHRVVSHPAPVELAGSKELPYGVAAWTA
jgi:hypothetical protein